MESWQIVTIVASIIILILVITIIVLALPPSLTVSASQVRGSGITFSWNRPATETASYSVVNQVNQSVASGATTFNAIFVPASQLRVGSLYTITVIMTKDNSKASTSISWVG